MPKNQVQRMLFAFITVVITVHAYVFFSLYVINGNTLTTYAGMAAGTQVPHVLQAIRILGGVEVFGKHIPIWGVVLVEFCLAYLLEVVMGSPLSFKLACKCFDPKETHPVLFETAIICTTVGLMCPAMSFLAAILYYPYSSMDFNLFTLLANWLKLVCFNFPFAFFTQLFFIQPLVRTIFKFLFVSLPKGQHKTAGETA
ncbi:MAG: hypothetical protein NC302_10760 [Bacteroidales bacterium]|nr:hypothetical protein [Bacteroidales bacterium]MCM1415086.1 hypothetical protein [bacterium]MCM1424393.1 hypothetical protein [bacterium]